MAQRKRVSPMEREVSRMSMGGAGGTGGRDLGAQRWGSEQEQIRKPAKNRNSREHFISAFPDRPIVCESRASSIHGAEACALLEIFRVLAKRGRTVPVVYGCRNSQSSQHLFNPSTFRPQESYSRKARRERTSLDCHFPGQILSRSLLVSCSLPTLRGRFTSRNGIQ
jgi:hypothetical protein